MASKVEVAPRVDVIIIGGGLSGVGAASHLRLKMPHLTYVILEARESMGGTWDHYKYPGVRTDSDMFTMAYSFNPWNDNKSTASAESVNAYIRETAEKFEVTKNIRFNEKVSKARWSSADATWTVESTHKFGARTNFVGSFIFMCAGYTNFSNIYDAGFKDTDKYKGVIAHPQKWPKDLDHKDKEVIVIGSGATAVTIVPALAQTAKHVTMLQRSPAYLLQLPNIDPWALFLQKYLPSWLAYAILRLKNIYEPQYYYMLSLTHNTELSRGLISLVRRALKKGYDVKKHFTPRYPVYTHRLGLSPDTIFTDCINDGSVTMVTETIDRFTETGVLLSTGEQLDADIVVTATGFDLYALGGIEIEVDGKLMENAATACMYKGALLCGVPNLVVALGYLTASWTLRIDMIWSYAIRMLRYLEGRKLRSFCPRAPPSDMELSSIFKIYSNSSYLTRGKGKFFMQGTTYPYAVNTSYYKDWWTFHWGALHDQWIEIK